MAIGTTAAILGAIGIGSKIAGGVIGSKAASSAANTQATAANQAAQMVQGSANTAADAVEGATASGQQRVEGATNQAITDATAGANAGITAVGDATTGANSAIIAALEQQRQNQSPYLQAGQMSLNALGQYLTGDGAKGFSYSPEEFSKTPGFQFEMEQGARALQRSAAARGGAVSGAAQKALLGFSQGLASTRYGEASDRAQKIYQMNRENTVNPLMSLIGIGQTATQSMNANEGAAGSQQAGNLMTAGQFAGNTLNNLGQYTGSTRMAGANSIAELGQRGATDAGRFRVGGADSAANYLTQGANATAAGRIARGNSWINAIGEGANFAGSMIANRNTNAGNAGSAPSGSSYSYFDEMGTPYSGGMKAAERVGGSPIQTASSENSYTRMLRRQAEMGTQAVRTRYGMRG